MYLAQFLLLILGMTFAGYAAYKAFGRTSFSFAGEPTLARYMTRPGQYRLGVITYVALCLLIYALVIYFYRDFLPIADLVAPPEFRLVIETWMSSGSLPRAVVVISAALIFVVLLSVDKDWNPAFTLRRVVYGCLSVPQLANSLMVLARDELVVPAEARTKVAGNPDTNVDLSDFDKDRHSLDRHWAETCYIRLWPAQNRAQWSHFTFFHAPSFSWENLETEYTRARNNIVPLKQGRASDPNLFADVASKIETLRRQYCRLAACFIVFKNNSKKNVLRDAQKFGVLIASDNSLSGFTVGFDIEEHSSNKNIVDSNSSIGETPSSTSSQSEQSPADGSQARAAAKTNWQWSPLKRAPSPLASSPHVLAGTQGDVTSRKIFLVHGRDEAAKNEVALFLRKNGLQEIILRDRPNKGRHLLKKFQEEAEGAAFAVVLMTPDDEGAIAGGTHQKRARQNVVFELGFFIGKFGTTHVAALVKTQVEKPSDFDGIAWIDFDNSGTWKNALARELREAGVPFDLDQVITA